MKKLIVCLVVAGACLAFGQGKRPAKNPYATYLGWLEKAELDYLGARAKAKRDYLAFLDVALKNLDLDRTEDFQKSKRLRGQRDRIQRQVEELTRRLKLAKTRFAAVEVEASHPVELAAMKPGVLKVKGKEVRWTKIPKDLVGATFTRHTWGRAVKYKLLCRRRGTVFVGAANPVFVPSQVGRWTQIAGVKLVAGRWRPWNVYRAKMDIGELLELTSKSKVSIYVIGDLRLP